MENQDTYAADAYLKLHEDVRKLILDTVTAELRRDPWGEFGTAVRGMISAEMDNHMQNYRIVRRGNTASY
jgi:hypothetical protein